jgi:hypothetical protein
MRPQRLDTEAATVMRWGAAHGAATNRAAVLTVGCLSADDETQPPVDSQRFWSGPGRVPS